MLRTLWIQNPTVSYRGAFGIGGSPSSQETLKKKIYPQATPEDLLFFYAANWEKEVARISPSENFAWPTKTPQASSKKRVQASDPEDNTLPTPIVEYEFQPHVRWVEWRWLQKETGLSVTTHFVHTVQV